MPYSLSPTKAVIFDMDGVLVDSNDLHLQAFQTLGRRFNRPFTAETMQRMAGMHNNQIMPLWLGDAAGPLSAELVNELAAEKEAHYRELAAASLLPIAGALDLIARLETAGMPFAVGSSGPRENVAMVLKRLGLEARVKAVISGSDLKHGKPDPEVFLKAAAALGLPPAQCTVFEDAVVGVQAARAAGCRAIAITSTCPREALMAAGAHAVINHFNEVIVDK